MTNTQILRRKAEVAETRRGVYCLAEEAQEAINGFLAGAILPRELGEILEAAGQGLQDAFRKEG